MNHNDIRHKLSEYIDGSVTPDEKAVIEDHLETCGECSDALRELRKTIEHINAVEEVQPPSWMTQKIMAKVREDAGRKKSLFQRLFYPLAVKLPIHAVAVLFLTVTAYYIYSGMHPADNYVEAPMSRFANQQAPAEAPDTVKLKAAENAEQREKKIAQEPGYKSLDMKYEYEKPVAPVPAEQPATVPAPAKQEAPLAAKDETDLGKRADASKATAPSLMARQAGPAAVTAPSSGTGQTLERKAKSSAAGDLEAEALLEVTEHFVRNDLPVTMKVKGLRYAARKFEKGLPDVSWMEGTDVFRSTPCSDRYLVDVDLSGNLSKYLYCYDNSHVRLLGIFELRNGRWIEIKGH